MSVDRPTGKAKTWLFIIGGTGENTPEGVSIQDGKQYASEVKELPKLQAEQQQLRTTLEELNAEKIAKEEERKKEVEIYTNAKSPSQTDQPSTKDKPHSQPAKINLDEEEENIFSPPQERAGSKQ